MFARREPTSPKSNLPLAADWQNTTGQQERAQGEGEDQDTKDSAHHNYFNLVNFLVLRRTFIFVYNKR